MLFWQDARALVEQGQDDKYLKFLPYVIGFIILVVFVFASRPFWMTNDDVSMAMITDGTGIAASPSPRLVLTNIAWGYLIRWLPGVGGIQSYTLATYAALTIAYATTLYALFRSEANALFASAILLIVFAPALVYPQYTLVAGYLAFAGIVLLCIPPGKQSIPSVYLAGALVVLSGLVRADETALVALIAIPVCIGYWSAAAGSKIRRHWLIVLAATAVVFVAFQFLDLETFGSGGWDEYSKTYLTRTEFTDFSLPWYYQLHARLMFGSGYTIDDFIIFKKWFYIDTHVFSVEKLAPFSNNVSWYGRAEANLKLFQQSLAPFIDPQILVLSGAVIFVLLFHQRRWYFLASIIVVAAVMFILLLMGRPGVTRIYIPVFAALAIMGIMQPTGSRPWIHACAALLAVSGTFWMLNGIHRLNSWESQASAHVQTVTCHMPHEPLVVIWGSDYPYSLEYPPFTPQSEVCPLKIYSIGEFSLAPYALEQLHDATGGKDLVPALLAGEPLDFIASPVDLQLLRDYFLRHYSVQLSTQQVMQDQLFTLYRVEKQPAAARLAAMARRGR